MKKEDAKRFDIRSFIKSQTAGFLVSANKMPEGFERETRLMGIDFQEKLLDLIGDYPKDFNSADILLLFYSYLVTDRFMWFASKDHPKLAAQEGISSSFSEIFYQALVRDTQRTFINLYIQYTGKEPGA